MIKLDYKAVIVSAIVGAIAVYMARKTAAKVIKAVNPLDDENVIYGAVSDIADVVAGDPVETGLPFGIRLYEIINGENG